MDVDYMDEQVINFLEEAQDHLNDQQRFALAVGLLEVLAESDPDGLTTGVATWCSASVDPDDERFHAMRECIARAAIALTSDARTILRLTR